jgi:predicted transcriptional regulator
MARAKTKPGEERLSPSEWEIMRICWRLGRANVRQMGFLEVEKEGNTNYYTAAVPQKKGLQREIDRFLKEVVGPEPENLELVERAVDKALRKTRRRG